MLGEPLAGSYWGPKNPSPGDHTIYLVLALAYYVPTREEVVVYHNYTPGEVSEYRVQSRKEFLALYKPLERETIKSIVGVA